jgi:hypothetical protein
VAATRVQAYCRCSELTKLVESNATFVRADNHSSWRVKDASNYTVGLPSLFDSAATACPRLYSGQ